MGEQVIKYESEKLMSLTSYIFFFLNSIYIFKPCLMSIKYGMKM